MLILPFQPSIPAYRFGTVINQVPYVFDVRWNSRAAAWYFDVSEQDGTAIRAGIKIVLGSRLGFTCQHPLFRNGIMVAADTTQQGQEAGFDDLGTRVEVRYIPGFEYLQRSLAVYGATPEIVAEIDRLAPVIRT